MAKSNHPMAQPWYEWLPIDTAPTAPPDHDSEAVLLWVTGGGDDGQGSVAFGRCYRSHDGSVRGVPAGYHGFTCSHWMPMPGPPNVQ